jgi:hypothetical protein
MQKPQIGKNCNSVLQGKRGGGERRKREKGRTEREKSNLVKGLQRK